VTTLADQGFLDLPPLRLEYRMIGPRPDTAPTIVMLHQGLGSAGLWRDFPDQLAAATGAGVFVYSRAGCGQSSGARLPRGVNFMQEEALDVLPRVLTAIGFQRGISFGHSGGAFLYRGDRARRHPPHARRLRRRSVARAAQTLARRGGHGFPVLGRAVA
jgi:pimeloyl-ACP methyl ester carboxylesterase